VDNEFEEVATQLLKRTQAMLNKYRFLLLEDAMVKCPLAWLLAAQPALRPSERKARGLHRTPHQGRVYTAEVFKVEGKLHT
jgi:hypothetical protein